ncbi:hypothetical protein [Plantibacter sp. YIM 135249]|uniref:hypothetical protein n=1 Tax=Plantibacter sp. YIM 135249 TaxID=3423918 RepID=UPI003D3267EB
MTDHAVAERFRAALRLLSPDDITPTGRRVLESIAAHPSGETFAVDAAGFLWTLRSQYPMTDRKPRDVFPRACQVCDEYAVGAEWGDGDAADVVVSCEHCGDVLPSASFRQIVQSLGHVHRWQSTGEKVTGRMLFRCECDLQGIEGRPGIDRHAVVVLEAPDTTPETSTASHEAPVEARPRVAYQPPRLPRIEPEEPVIVCSSCWITPCICGGAS